MMSTRISFSRKSGAMKCWRSSSRAWRIFRSREPALNGAFPSKAIRGWLESTDEQHCEIVADYFLTQERLAPWLEEQLAAEPDAAKHPEMIEFRDTRAESIVAILRHLDTKYGGPEAYLRHGGLTDEDLSKLRARLVS